MLSHTGAYIVAVGFAVLGVAAVSGTKLGVTSEIPFCAAAKIQHCDTPAILKSFSADTAWSEHTVVSGFL